MNRLPSKQVAQVRAAAQAPRQAHRLNKAFGRGGIQELEIHSGGESISRVRKTRGGSKKLREKDSGLASAIDALIEPYTWGEPERPLR